MLKVTIRGFLAHKGRMTLAGLSVVLSVAFIVGTLVLTDTLSQAATDRARAVAADVTVTPKAGDEHGPSALATLPAGLADRVRAVPGAGQVRGVVQVPGARILDHRDHAVGGSTVAESWPQPPARLAAGHAPQGPGDVVLDRQVARAAGVGLGDPVRVVTAGHGGFPATVVGLATRTTSDPGQAHAYLAFEAAAARLLGRPGLITSVEVDTAAGTSVEGLRTRLDSALAGGYELRTQAEMSGDTTMADGLRGPLLAFAGLALLVGIFLIVNTFAMLIAQRTRELGLLRALGASRRQIRRAVLGEALLLGLAGSLCGVAAGLAGVGVLRAVLGITGALAFQPSTLLAGLLAGTLATLLAARTPALRAGRIPPMAALREAALDPLGRREPRVRTACGILLMALAGGLLAAGAAPLVSLGMLVSLVAAVLLGPALVRLCVPVLASPLPKMFGRIGALVQRNALRNRRRTGSTAAALMIGTAVAVMCSVYAASSSASMDARVDRMFGADFMVKAESGDKALGGRQSGFGPEVVEAVRRSPGIGTVVPELQSPVMMTAGGRTYNWILYGDDPGFPGMLREGYTAGDGAEALGSGKVITGADVARETGLTVGGTVTLRALGGPPTTLTIGAVQRVEPPGGSIGRVRGAPMVGTEVMRRIAPRAIYTSIFAKAAHGADPAAAGRALTRTLETTPQVTVQNRTAYKEAERESADQLLKIVYGLLALTIVVSVLGVINTLALSTIERTREIGLMRAVGTSRAQVRQLIRSESVVITGYGVLLGLALGLSWGLAMWRAMPALDVLAVPWLTVAAVIVGAGLAGLVAAIVPAARAVRLNILSAISTE